MTRRVRFLRSKPIGLVPLLGMLASACSADVVGSAQDSVPGLSIVPFTASLAPGGTATFVALARGAVATGVEWSASGGSITSAGVFTAPTELGSYQIQASVAGVTGAATATVVPPGTPAALYGSASVACANMPLRSTGTIYYFCDCQAGAQGGCVPGNDANAGTSSSAPKRRWYAATVRFNSMNAGDTIALCKGGAWNLNVAHTGCGSSDPGATNDTGNALANASCGSGAPYTEAQLKDPANTTTCDIRDYTPSWGGTNKPLVATTASSQIIIGRAVNTLNGVRILNLDFRGSGTGPAGSDNGQQALYQGSCNQAFDNYWLIGNNTFRNFSRAFHLAENHSFSTYVFTWGNRFLLNTNDAILGGPGSYSKIDANYFDNNGGPNRIHTVYMGSYPEFETVNASVVNNEFRRTQVSTVGACASPILQTHDRYDNLNIENNVIDGGTNPTGACWGMALNAAGSNPTALRNTTIRRNWVNASGALISFGQGNYSFIEDNVLIDTSATTAKASILIPGDSADRQSDIDVNGATTNNTIRNNTIYQSGAAGGGIYAMHLLLSVGSGNVIANNSVWMGGGGTCFGTDAGTYAFVGNNACYGGAAWGTTYDATAHVTSDPMFISPPTDFTPAAGSPLIGAGSAAYAPPTDFTLMTRPVPPSIGAYEP